MFKRISTPAACLAFALLAACGEGEVHTTDGSAPADDRAVEAAADANTRELADHDVTMDDLRKLAAAQTNLAELKRSRPDLKAALEGDDSEEDTSDATFDDIEAKINQIPEARAAIESAGLDVRRYVVILLGLVHAGMADAMIQHGMNQDSVVRDLQINPDNLEFVRANREEVGRVMEIGEDG